MMIKKGRQRASACVLAIAFIFSALILPKVYAAVGVQTDKMCSLQIDMRECGFQELHGVSALPIEVSLYKVADIDVSGNYTAVSSFEALAEELEGVDSETQSEEWKEMALKVKSQIEAKPEVATALGITEHGMAVMDHLETGLYLVDAKEVVSEDYIYEFTPFLVSLPNNYYYSTNNDTWVYDLIGDHAISLKVVREDRLGDLVINKELDAYNATVGGATFVFRIEATKTDLDVKEEDPSRIKVVYSDVVSMTFTEAGTDSITIKGLPAGAEVTVTEIYSGASYKLTTEASMTKEIRAGEEAQVYFENTYDYRFNGGSGIVNSFIYDSQTQEWQHTQSEDSTP